MKALRDLPPAEVTAAAGFEVSGAEGRAPGAKRSSPFSGRTTT